MRSNILRTIVFTALVLGILVGVLRFTCLRWWRVPEDDPDLAASIAPTLAPGDLLILWRASSPGFGDLVVCPDPENAGMVVLGRIAAESNDKLVVDEGGWITVNNARARSEQACDPPKFSIANPRNGDDVELRCDVETLGGVHHQRAVVPPDKGLKPPPVKRDVEPGTVFLISDNRAYPFDSRDFGPLPRASCGETVVFRLVSRLGFSHVKTRLSWIQ
jgi:signal peptidase I